VHFIFPQLHYNGVSGLRILPFLVKCYVVLYHVWKLQIYVMDNTIRTLDAGIRHQ